ncbi:hypothetical protein IGL98_000725 [Enterococcus sp. DIV0840]
MQMPWGIIATWRMAHDGVVQASESLTKNGQAGDAIEATIQTI